MVDELTVLTTSGFDSKKLLTKRWYASEGGPVAETYSKAAWFAVTKVPVFDLWTFEEELTRLQDAPYSCVIRGDPKPGVDLSCTRRWAKTQEDGSPPTFEDKPRRWLLLDIDDVAPEGFAPTDGWQGAALLRSMLPDEFKTASCWWSFSGSAGVKSGLRMRLAFWLERPVSGDELGRWFMSSPVDHAVFRTVQAIYTAAPIFNRNMHDPITERCGLLVDGDDLVQVPDLSPPPEKPETQRTREVEEFKVRYGEDWAIIALRDAVQGIVKTLPAGMNNYGGGGRHHALFCAALRCSRLVDMRALPQSDVERALAAAALAAGIKDNREISRTIRNGFRQGGLT